MTMTSDIYTIWVSSHGNYLTPRCSAEMPTARVIAEGLVDLKHIECVAISRLGMVLWQDPEAEWLKGEPETIDIDELYGRGDEHAE